MQSHAHISQVASVVSNEVKNCVELRLGSVTQLTHQQYFETVSRWSQILQCFLEPISLGWIHNASTAKHI